MRSSTAVCSSIFVLALAAPALWSDDASAVMPPPVCGDLCETCVTTPARYTAGAAGTVALTANSGSTASAALAPLIAAINGTYYHAVALYDASGNHFTEAEFERRHAASQQHDRRATRVQPAHLAILPSEPLPRSGHRHLRGRRGTRDAHRGLRYSSLQRAARRLSPQLLPQRRHPRRLVRAFARGLLRRAGEGRVDLGGWRPSRLQRHGNVERGQWFRRAVLRRLQRVHGHHLGLIHHHPRNWRHRLRWLIGTDDVPARRMAGRQRAHVPGVSDSRVPRRATGTAASRMVRWHPAAPITIWMAGRTSTPLARLRRSSGRIHLPATTRGPGTCWARAR